MKTITNDFKQAISKLGREIDLKFLLHTNDKILAENGNFLMTQANQHLVVEQFDDEEVDDIITGEDIYNTSIVNRGELLSTMMKEIDFEVKQDLRVGDVIGCQFGVKVGEEYEYIDFGKYMIYSKEYNEDTKTYSYIAYDRMLLTMQEVPNPNILVETETTTIQDLIEYICSTVGLDVSELYPGYGQGISPFLNEHQNLLKNIHVGTFNDLELTYRDVLDQICQALGLSMIVDKDKLKLKTLDSTIVDTFDETFLKDTNVSFGENYMVNSVVLSRSEDNDNIYRRDEESVAEYGVHEFKIKDNLIMLYDDREDYIDEIFEQLNGLEYYINDFSSTGITYLDWLDFYNVTIGDKTYKCLMLDDEIEINQGLEENIYSEMPIETVTNYKTSSKTDKEVSFIVDKQGGSIKAKVSKGEVINEINLDESGAEINADKISLAGKTIELTSDDIAINSTNFKVDKDGNMIANSGTFGGTLYTGKDCTIGDNLYVGQSQASSGAYERYIKMTENTYIRRWRNQGSLSPYPYEMLSLQSNGIQLITTSSTQTSSATPFYSIGHLTRIQSTGQNISMDLSSITMSSQPVIGSDERLKQEIKDIDTSWIDELKIKEFEYIKSPEKKQIGLIAQDYEDKEYGKYFLNKNEGGYYGITYGNITNALIQYCQEMKKEINSLKEEIKQLKESDK